MRLGLCALRPTPPAPLLRFLFTLCSHGARAFAGCQEGLEGAEGCRRRFRCLHILHQQLLLWQRHRGRFWRRFRQRWECIHDLPLLQVRQESHLEKGPGGRCHPRGSVTAEPKPSAPPHPTTPSTPRFPPRSPAYETSSLYCADVFQAPGYNKKKLLDRPWVSAGPAGAQPCSLAALFTLPAPVLA